MFSLLDSGVGDIVGSIVALVGALVDEVVGS